MMVRGMDRRMERHGADTIVAVHAAVQRLYVTSASQDEYQRAVSLLPELVLGLQQLHNARQQRASQPAVRLETDRDADHLLVTSGEGPLGTAVETLLGLGPAGE
jgi:hypothetical protein